MAFDGIYRLPRADARGGREVSYTVRVWPARLHGMAQDGWLPETERLADVEIHPRVRALARTWCADLLDKSPPGGVMSDETARRIAEHLTNRLREHCTYTLDLTDASGSRDGVEDFLFHLKRGHCVACAMSLADAERSPCKDKENYELVTCKCRRVYIYDKQINSYRRAKLDEVE